MNKLAAVLITILLLTLTGCTANDRAKNYGGTMTVNLPAGQKLVNTSWKNADMWYLTRPSRDGEKPEVLTLHEDSNFGMMQGKVIFKEH
ncbi:MAG: Brevibacillus phage Jenst [Candidatus Parcubacteria bacterium]|jgi:hypothetical protein